jgi:hypothetical protein
MVRCSAAADAAACRRDAEGEGDDGDDHSGVQKARAVCISILLRCSEPFVLTTRRYAEFDPSLLDSAESWGFGSGD